MPSGEDVWWSMIRADDPTSVAEHVVSALLDLAVPWLISKTTE